MTLLRIPGPVDPHVHLRDLDWSHKGTFESETAAALAGGYWAVLDMPNTPPPTTSGARLSDKLTRLGTSARCDYGVYLGADQVQVGDDFAAAAPDCVGLKLYCDATTGDLLIDDDERRAAIMASWGSLTDRPVAVHAEGPTMESILAHVRAHRVVTHFCHVSDRTEIALLRAAKRDGLPISVGVTPHHLYLTDVDAQRMGGFGRVKPALKSALDVAALWDAVGDGTVDVIESDHAPHALHEKSAPDAAFGLPGLETTLPLMALAVREARISADRLIELLATNAQRIFALAPPHDTFTLVDLDASYVIDDADLRTAPGWSPFSGMRVWGRVREVRIGGQAAFDGERVLAEPGSGRNVA